MNEGHRFYVAFAGVAGVLLAQAAGAWAVCPSGITDPIFCDDFDWYCNRSTCGADPNLPCPADGSCPKSGAVQNVWVTTSRNDCNGNVVGPMWNIEDALEVFSEPYGNSLTNNYNAPVLAHTTVTITDNILNTHNSPAVIGTDEHPLIMSVKLQNQTGGKVLANNTYFELSLGNDRANTDFVSRDCTACGSPWPEWAHVICAQNTPVAGCPDPSTAPVHASIGAGHVALLDTDPCYEDGACASGSRNRHLAYYDGKLWWQLTEGLFPGSGTFSLYDDLSAMTLTIMGTQVVIEYTTYNEAIVPPEGPSGLTIREYSVAVAPRAYEGAFDVLHAGMATQCEISASSANPWGTCVDALANYRCHRPRKYVPGAGRQIIDDFVLSGGEPFFPPPPLGACCKPDGTCAQADESTCADLGGTYQGDKLGCGVVPCFQACGRYPYAAADGDNDVDMDDFAAFQRCIDSKKVPAGCGCFDRGLGYPDGKIDTDDFEAFLGCATGAGIPFLGSQHPDCPPHPGIPAPLWMHEDFESYADSAAFDVAWPRTMGGGLDLNLTGGIDGPQSIGGAKTDQRRHYHVLAPHIQAAAGGEGKTTVYGTDEAPLVFEAAYQLDLSPEVAQQQDFFWELAKGDDMAPRGYGSSLRASIGFGAFTRYPGDGLGKRAGLMVYDGQKWTHLTTLKHGAGWNYITVRIRSSTMEITYYDESRSHGVQTLLLSRVYKGSFDKLAIDTDDCLSRVKAADGFKLSGGVFANN